MSGESYQLLRYWHPSSYPGSVPALVGLVSVYYDWVKWQAGSVTFMSVRQHINPP